MKLPQHVFISYSRQNSEFVDKLYATLVEEGIPVWLDQQNIRPGTPNWENSIKTAIADAVVVVLIVSPASKESAYVQGELALAEANNCPILPIWVEGEAWAMSVPLQMIRYQYIDCRSDEKEKGINQLILAIDEVMTERTPLDILIPKTESSEIPAYMMSIELDSESALLVQPRRFRTMNGLLNFLYIRYLYKYYDPFTYEADWILTRLGRTFHRPESDFHRIAGSWNWLVRRAGLPLLNDLLEFGESPLINHGFVGRSKWHIVNPNLLHPIGIIGMSMERVLPQLVLAGNSREDLETDLASAKRKQILKHYLSNNTLRLVEPNEINAKEYVHSEESALVMLHDVKNIFIHAHMKALIYS